MFLLGNKYLLLSLASLVAFELRAGEEEHLKTFKENSRRRRYPLSYTFNSERRASLYLKNITFIITINNDNPISSMHENVKMLRAIIF